MKTVQVLLRESVKDLGKVGDVVDVAAGYARNYLVPRRIAVEATDENKKMMTRRRALVDAQEAALAADVAARVAALEAVTVTTSAKADENGHLYGSVTAANIGELLAAAGHKTDEKDVRLEHAIKETGSHAVPVHVHGDSSANITVVVEAAAEE
ncbi:MAG: 50S ribosomal protein L9 [Planctomycetota bacterium]